MKTGCSRVKASIFYIFSCVLVAFTIGCNRPHPSPEDLDPIFLDLTRRAQEAKRLYKEELAKRDSALLAIQRSEVNSLDIQVARKDWISSNQKLPLLEQKAQFLSLQAERRKVTSRLAYRLAYEKGEEWPNPEEYQAYKTHRRLREAPRTWDHRVPSNIHRYTKSEMFHVEQSTKP